VRVTLLLILGGALLVTGVTLLNIACGFIAAGLAVTGVALFTEVPERG